MLIIVVIPPPHQGATNIISRRTSYYTQIDPQPNFTSEHFEFMQVSECNWPFSTTGVFNMPRFANRAAKAAGRGIFYELKIIKQNTTNM